MSLSDRLTGLLGNSSFVFTLAIIVGLIFNGGASWTEPALLPVLAIIMTISILDVSSRIFLNLRTVLLPVLTALLLSYGILGVILIGLSSLIINDPELRSGFVLVAAVPPAVAVIPLTHLLGGNTEFSLVGNVVAYVAALAVTPLICILFLGANFIDPVRLLIVLSELIVAPILVSRILRRTRIVTTVDRWRNPVVNWGFFLVIYTMVGLNRDVFLGQPYTLLLTCAIAFTGTFVFGELINRILEFLGMAKGDRISLILFGTRKNYGLAGAIGLIFFSSRAAMPAAVVSAMSVLHFIWLSWRIKRMH